MTRRPTRAAQLGVSDDEYTRLLETQDGHCALCPATPKTRRLHVDHDHGTGKIRGLLCHRCNRALPTWTDAGWLLKAALYLSGQDWPEIRSAWREQGDAVQAKANAYFAERSAW